VPRRTAVHVAGHPSPADAGTRPRYGAAVTTVVVLCAASMLVLGIWAYGWPLSFAELIDYAPYNRHLVHDAGAFQIGISVSLLAAIVTSDGLLVALSRFTVASGLHTISHYLDRHIGGHDSDVPTLGLLTLIALLGIGTHVHRRRKP
jgi:hypothetical protein